MVDKTEFAELLLEDFTLEEILEQNFLTKADVVAWLLFENEINPENYMYDEIDGLVLAEED